MDGRKIKDTRELIDSIIEERTAQSKSQTEIGEPNYTRSQISKLEHTTSLPSLDKIFHVLAQLGVDVYLKKQKNTTK